MTIQTKIIIIVVAIIVLNLVFPITKEGLKRKIKHLCFKYFTLYGKNDDGTLTTGIILYEDGIGGVKIKYEPCENDN